MTTTNEHSINFPAPTTLQINALWNKSIRERINMHKLSMQQSYCYLAPYVTDNPWLYTAFFDEQNEEIEINIFIRFWKISQFGVSAVIESLAATPSCSCLPDIDPNLNRLKVLLTCDCSAVFQLIESMIMYDPSSLEMDELNFYNFVKKKKEEEKKKLDENLPFVFSDLPSSDARSSRVSPLSSFDRQNSLETLLMEMQNEEGEEEADLSEDLLDTHLPYLHVEPSDNSVPLSLRPVNTSTSGEGHGSIINTSITLREWGDDVSREMMVVSFSHENDSRDYELLFELEFIRSLIDERFYNPVPVLINRLEYAKAVDLVDVSLNPLITKSCTICLASIIQNKNDLTSIVVETKCCKQLFHDCCLSHFICKVGPPCCPLCRHDFREKV